MSRVQKKKAFPWPPKKGDGGGNSDGDNNDNK